MVTHSSTIVKALTALLIFIAVGCVKQSSTPLSPSTQTVVSTGTISGVIKDAWTAVPVKGAIISLAYNGSVASVTSDTSGGFTFSNVPVENVDDNNKPYVARTSVHLVHFAC